MSNDDDAEKRRRMGRYMKTYNELVADKPPKQQQRKYGHEHDWLTDDDMAREAFACAALTGLLSVQRDVGTDELCRMAWHIANVMLEER